MRRGKMTEKINILKSDLNQSEFLTAIEKGWQPILFACDFAGQCHLIEAPKGFIEFLADIMGNQDMEEYGFELPDNLRPGIYMAMTKYWSKLGNWEMGEEDQFGFHVKDVIEMDVCV